MNRGVLRSFRKLSHPAVLAMTALTALEGLSAMPSDEGRHHYAQFICSKFALGDRAVPEEVRKRLEPPGREEAKDVEGRLWRTSTRGLLEIDATGARKLWAGKDGLPVRSLTGLATGPEGRVWMGSPEGAVCFHPDGPPQRRWFYFWGKRYLEDNEVQSIVAERGQAWIRTRTGISLIAFRPYDLEQKSALFIDRLEQRHNRYGYAADCALLRPGDAASFRPEPSDNDGLWTAIYVAAECYRYAVTQSPEALRSARASLTALTRLESITGIPGFPARALIRKGDYRVPEGEWHWTADGEWEWKGDTSSDELVGHFFAYSLAYDLLPDESDRAAIRPVVARLANHLLEHGLNLVGPGGRITRWGRYSPGYFETPDGRVDRALNSLEILSHLRVAYQVTREEKFLRAYRRLVNELGYLRNVTSFATEAPVEVNYSDEELAFLAFYPVLKLEDDPGLRKQYVQALEGLWNRTRDEENPLWNFIFAVGSGSKDESAQRDSLDSLERIPLDTISWTVRNSQRLDLTMDGSRGRFGEKQSRRAIPPNERAMMKWNGNPFELDGGNGGRSEDDGAFFLLPYWLGRYHNLLSP